jgi:L-asparaginase
LLSIFNTPNLKGVIIETYGAGNCSTEDWFISLLKETIKKGIHIINITQCSGGSVMMGQYETSEKLKKIGVISGKDITTEAAVSKSMYLLGQNISPNCFKRRNDLKLIVKNLSLKLFFILFEKRKE